MPNPFNPARLRGAARGLRVVEGEASAKARASALRKSASRRVQPEYTLLDVEHAGSEPFPGVVPERTFRGVSPAVEADAAEALARGAGARFSGKATAEQSMRAEALRRHAGTPDFDPRSLADDAGPSADVERLNAILEGRPEPELPPGVRDFAERQARGAYGDLDEGDVADITERLRGAVQGQPPRGTARKPSFLLDAFERQYGWRPASEKEALDMLSPEALRELGFDPDL